MKFNKHMTNGELLYKLNYAYTLKQENFHKVLDITKERLDKLTELENIEEELGIDLITLFKALRNDVYFKVDNIILHCQVSNITSNSIYIRPDYYTENRKYDSKYWQRDWTPGLKDYGKNWALTKEELENEK